MRNSTGSGLRERAAPETSPAPRAKPCFPVGKAYRLVYENRDRLVPPETAAPETIHRAMRYSLFAGGKRIRPILCLEAARAGGCVADGGGSAGSVAGVVRD